MFDYKKFGNYSDINGQVAYRNVTQMERGRRNPTGEFGEVLGKILYIGNLDGAHGAFPGVIVVTADGRFESYPIEDVRIRLGSATPAKPKRASNAATLEATSEAV